MSKPDIKAPTHNEKLISSIISILEEEKLVTVFRRYADVPLDTLILFLFESHYKDNDKESAYSEVKRESLFRIKRRWVNLLSRIWIARPLQRRN